MFSHDFQTKFKLTNPYIFWGLISIFFFLTLFLSQYFTSSSSSEEIKVTPSIVEQSYKENRIVIDPDNLHRMNFENHLSTSKAEGSFLGDVYIAFSENSTVFVLLFYTIILSVLFIYREKQDRKKAIYDQKKNDDLIIARLQAEERVEKIHKNMWDDMEKYKHILEPELKICSLREQLENNIDCCMVDGIIVSTRKVLEKILLPLQHEAFPNFKGIVSLNGMIHHLGKKGILTRSMENDTKAIQSVGNRAAHADTDATIALESRDAISAINYLLRFIKELDALNNLKG